MDFYEELGLTSAASATEIHQAYKRLAKEYHPDKRTADAQRRWAETQMRRLNEIFETLSNPESRERYDRTLRALAIQEIADHHAYESFLLLRDRRKKVWATTAAVLACTTAVVAYLVTGHDTIGDRISSRLTTPSVTEAASPVPKAKVKTPDRNISQERPNSEPVQQASQPPVERTRTPTRTPRLDAPPELPHAVPMAASPLVETARVDIPPAPPVRNPPGPSTVAGTWIFSPTHATASNLSFAAEYVEVSIRTLNQRLSGAFRGTYNVRSSTFPPRVQFRFEGSVDDFANGIGWKSENGAEGVIKFHRLSDKELEVGWYTTRFAAIPALTSGNAVLQRDLSQP